MKRFTIIFLSFLIIFNSVSCNVFASSSSTGSSWWEMYQNGTLYISDSVDDMINWGDNTIQIMTTGEVYRLVSQQYPMFPGIIATYDAVTTAVGSGMDYFLKLVKSGNDPSTAISTMQNSISINGDGNKIISGDGLVIAENYYNGNLANNELEYVNFYVPNANYLNPNEFEYSSIYNFVKTLMNNNPDYWFTITYYQYGSGNYYHIFCTNQNPLGGILARQYWGMDKALINLYNDNWTQDFSINSAGDKAMIEVSTPNSENLDVHYVNGEGDYVHLSESDALSLDLDSILIPDSTVNQVPQDAWVTFESVYVYGSTSALLKAYRNNDPQVGVNQQNRKAVLFHGAWGSGVSELPIFSNLSGLKKGTIGLSTQQVLPTFNGNGINNSPISDSQVQQAEEIINNYYSDKNKNNGNGNNGNNGNNNNDNDGIWDILAGALKHIIDIIVDVVGSGLEKIAGLFEHLVSIFESVGDLVGSGFSSLVASFFPYLPSEWITLVTLSLGLTLFFWVIRKFL